MPFSISNPFKKNEYESCMNSVKTYKESKDAQYDYYKPHIQEAEEIADIILGIFQEVFRQKPSAKKTLEKTADLETVKLCVLIIFASRGFYHIARKEPFNSSCNTCLSPSSNAAACIMENCLSSLGIKQDYIKPIMKQFYEIRNMYKLNEGTLPLYDLVIPTETPREYDKRDEAIWAISRAQQAALEQHWLWNFNDGQAIVDFIKNQL